MVAVHTESDEIPLILRVDTIVRAQQLVKVRMCFERCSGAHLLMDRLIYCQNSREADVLDFINTSLRRFNATSFVECRMY
jgi:hypothetical protein